ncbi:alpha/beta fold hydrolase [Mycobacteriaceae bacterium NPDC060252]
MTVRAAEPGPIQAQITEHYVDHGGYRVRELAVAGTSPTVVFLHGFGHAADCWLPVLESCANAGQRAVAIDLPGFGKSAPLGGGSILEQLDTCVSDLIVRRSDGERVVLVGNSLGALLALRAAQRSRALPVLGVVALGAPGFGWTRIVRAICLANNAGLRALSYVVPALPMPAFLAVRVATYLCYGRKDRADPQMLGLVTGQLADRTATRRLLKLAVRLKGEVDQLSPLGVIDSRCTVVHGSRDPLVSLRGARTVRRVIAGSRLVVLPHAGHCPQLDEHDRVTQLVLELTRATAARP